MHSLVRRYIRTAIAFLAVALLLGGWMIARRELGGIAPHPYESTAHAHAFLVGFMMMMIQGVALWLFPRPEKDDTRYRPAAAEAAYWLVTLGTAVRTAGELTRAALPAEWVRWAIVIAGFMQIAGIGLFFYTMSSRIRPGGSQQREAKGERF